MSSSESAVCGLLVVDKPAGCTSHDVVNRVRRLFGTRQVGHSGTLDPMATGVLPVLIGRAVKAARFLTAERKRYRATLQLGISTDTEDTTGRVLRQAPAEDIPPVDAVLAAAREVAARRTQIPPMVSALKRDGQKLADLARRGVTVEREPREVTVFSLDISPAETGARPVLYNLALEVSAGTYVRSFCRDVGDLLGCGGAMASLRRTASGRFTEGDALPLDALEANSAQELAARVLPLDALFADLPSLALPPFFEHLARCGQEIYLRKLRVGDLPEGTRVRLCDECGALFALGEIRKFSGGLAAKAVVQFEV